MPLTSPNFTATQSLGVLSQLTFVDVSTGSDVGLTSRRITVTLADGTTLVTTGTTTPYNLWAIGDVSTTLNLLSSSTAAFVRVDWLTGNVVTYTKTVLYDFNLYDYVFGYNLTQLQTSQPTIVSDTNYYNSKIKLLINIDDSENAVALANDIYSAQGSLDRNQLLINNQSLFF